jgi:hypothetical protein
MHARAAALGNANLVIGGLVDRANRHGLGGDAHQAEADGKHGCSKQSHWYFPFSSFAATRHNDLRRQILPAGNTEVFSSDVGTGLREENTSEQKTEPGSGFPEGALGDLTSGDGANDASGGGANGDDATNAGASDDGASDGDASPNDDASDRASAPAPALPDQHQPVSLPLIPHFRCAKPEDPALRKPAPAAQRSQLRQAQSGLLLFQPVQRQI